MTRTKKAVKEKGYRNIGIAAQPPAGRCDDANCPWHSSLPLRGRNFTGTVMTDKAAKTAVVRWEYVRPVTKYQRFERRHGSVIVHNPPCIAAKVGDKVKIAECRPLSKNKSFVIIEKVL